MSDRWARLQELVETASELGPDERTAYLAAEAGQGIALGDDLLVGDALDAGRLVKALDVSCPSGSYQLHTRQGAPLSDAAEAFVAWLWQEIEKVHGAGPVQAAR